MKISFRFVFRLLAWMIGVFLTLWLLVWGYVIFNKKTIIGQVNTMLNSKVKGEIRIGDLEPSLISTFPLVSLRLSNVIVRDTMWKQHHHDLLKADRIYIRLALLSLFSGSPEITKVIIDKGSVYVFSDSTGFTNEYMFKTEKSSGAEGNSKFSLPDIDLKNVRIVLDLKHRSKLYDFEVTRLKCDIKTRETELQMDIKTNMIVHNLAFNTGNGSFVKERPLEGKFRLYFDRIKKILEFKDVVLEVDDHPFGFSGMFDLSSAPPLYFLQVKVNKISYRMVSALLSPNIGAKLDSFNIENPISAVATLDGTTRPNRIPLVNVEVQIKNNTLSTPIGQFTEASMTGRFTNQLNKEELRVDKNSGFSFTGFSGKWEDIRFKSDTITITNLEHPVLDCDVSSSFKMEALNELLGSNTLEFTKGDCDVNLKYRGFIIEGDTAGVSLNGIMNLKNAAINYIPRNLLFTKCSGQIEFDEKDVYVKQLKALAGNSQLLMNGGVKNLTSLIEKTPEKLILDWNIASPKLNLSDFISYLGKRSSPTSKSSAKRRLLKLANRIDRMLQDCSVELQLNADRLTYKKFEASKVAANLQLTDRLVSLKRVLVQHAGGTLALGGSLREEGAYNLIKLNCILENVNVTKVFAAFNNFGQDGITDKNIGGLVSAKINLTGAISDKAVILENSLKGIVDLHLKDGELNNFEPVQNISKTAFKNRDFSHIRFAELKERLEINGSEIKVNRMEIQSSIVTMFVEGIYDVKKGTDLSIQVPLSNIGKKQEEYDLVNKGVKSKTGVSLRLRAKTGEDGKAKISWDPFKLALKKKDQPVADSTTKVPKPSATKKDKPVADTTTKLSKPASPITKSQK